MSADTSVAIAAHVDEHGERRWTAQVIQNAENLLGEDLFALNVARDIFLKGFHCWFPTLSLAKQFAELLTVKWRVSGVLEYEKRVVVEFSDFRIQRLSYRKGNPIGKVYRIPSY